MKFQVGQSLLELRDKYSKYIRESEAKFKEAADMGHFEGDAKQKHGGYKHGELQERIHRSREIVSDIDRIILTAMSSSEDY